MLVLQEYRGRKPGKYASGKWIDTASRVSITNSMMASLQMATKLDGIARRIIKRKKGKYAVYFVAKRGDDNSMYVSFMGQKI